LDLRLEAPVGTPIKCNSEWIATGTKSSEYGSLGQNTADELF